jgi:hypothetical protein
VILVRRVVRVSVVFLARLGSTGRRLGEIAFWVRLEAILATPAAEAVFPTCVLGPKLGIGGHRHAADRVAQSVAGWMRFRWSVHHLGLLS